MGLCNCRSAERGSRSRLRSYDLAILDTQEPSSFFVSEHILSRCMKQSAFCCQEADASRAKFRNMNSSVRGVIPHIHKDRHTALEHAFSSHTDSIRMLKACMRSSQILGAPQLAGRASRLDVHRQFHVSAARLVVRPFLLSDPGEGITLSNMTSPVY